MNATEQLAALDARVEEAQQRYEAALSAKRHGRGADAGTEALAPVQQYHRDVEARRRDADVDELRRLTAEACERITERGLTFFIPTPGRIHITDPEVDIEATAALDAVNAALVERDEYERESRDERDAERRRAEADKIKDALDSGDADAIREALNPSGDGPLSTADLGGPVEREVTGTVFHIA